MKRLRFVFCDKDRVEFYNDKEERVGGLERSRVGQFMQWVYFLEECFYLSGGCSDEVREIQRKLNTKAKAGLNLTDLEGIE